MHLKPYNDLNTYYQEKFGTKVYKLSLDGGFTCPNRDGTLGYDGCIFCSNGGSGDFSVSTFDQTIEEAITQAKLRIHNKTDASKFIAYFQAFTNTYAPVETLRQVYQAAISHPEIVGISIATRPDCLSDDVIALLKELNELKPIWVELGLQSIHEKSALWMRRGYTLEVYNDAVNRLSVANIPIVVHIILGLPTESTQDMLETIDYVAHQNIEGIKLQLLHVLKDTDLGKQYLENPFPVFTQENYIEFILTAIARLPQRLVIHRLTGDGPKSLLLAPMWSSNKKAVLNALAKAFKSSGVYQGQHYN